MKTFLLLSLFGLIATTAKAQQVELKDGKVLVDEKPVLSYVYTNTKLELTLYKLNTEEELVFLMENENPNKQYYKIRFTGDNLKMKTKNISTWKRTVKWLVDNKIFDQEWNLNIEKVKLFIDKYNEDFDE